MEYLQIRGRIYDVDFIHGREITQILIRRGDETPALVTKDVYIQSLAESSIVASRPVTVEYKENEEGDKEIVSIAMSIDPASKHLPGQLLELVLSGDKCIARVATEANEVKVFTRNRRAQSVLEAAFALSLPVQYLTFEENEPEGKEITRVKINVEVPSSL